MRFSYQKISNVVQELPRQCNKIRSTERLLLKLKQLIDFLSLSYDNGYKFSQNCLNSIFASSAGKNCELIEKLLLMEMINVAELSGKRFAA